MIMKKLALIAVLAMSTPIFGQSTEPQNGDKWAYFEVKNGDEKGVFVTFVKHLLSKGIAFENKDIDFFTAETKEIETRYDKYIIEIAVEKSSEQSCTVWCSFRWVNKNEMSIDLGGVTTKSTMLPWQYKSSGMVRNRDVYNSFAPLISSYPNIDGSVWYRYEKRSTVFVADQKPEPKPEPKPMELPVGIPTYSGR